MEINELPSPMFVANDDGRLTVFLPAFEGEPESPTLSKKDEKTLYFQRSAGGDCLFTDVPEDVMTALSQVEKMLVIESNIEKSIDIAEKLVDAALKEENGEKADESLFEGDIEDIVERAYEIQVNV